MPLMHTVAHRFTEIVQRFGDRPALKFFDGTTITYHELEDLSLRLAGMLSESGVRRDMVVAMVLHKGPLAYGAMLACLYLGAPYVHLDSSSPVDRTLKIIDRCRPGVLLTDQELPGRLLEALNVKNARAIGPDIEPQHFPPLRSAPGSQATGATPAYLMFTSGSTGFPKGAVISHAALLHFNRWATQTLDIRPDDRLTNVNPLYFDNSVFDIYASLLTGACLYPLTRENLLNAHATVKYIEAAGCTIWFSVPSLLVYLTTLRAISQGSLRSMRAVCFGGEGYPKSELRKLFTLIGNHTRLINVYGPTECTCICSSHIISEADFTDDNSLASLGRIAPNIDYLILDEQLHPVAPGEAGELCLLGPQLALGYWRDPERTAQSFVLNPVNAAYPERMYLTGDLVCEDSEGKLWFRGRKDNQIKHMGYRIELEEIDAALYSIPGVREASACYLHGHAAFGRIVAAIAGEGLCADLVRHQLREKLPPYMVPEDIVLFETLPKNANGKISRADVATLAGGDASA